MLQLRALSAQYGIPCIEEDEDEEGDEVNAECAGWEALPEFGAEQDGGE